MHNKLFFGTLLMASSGLMAGTFTYSNILSDWQGVGYTSAS